MTLPSISEPRRRSESSPLVKGVGSDRRGFDAWRADYALSLFRGLGGGVVLNVRHIHGFRRERTAEEDAPFEWSIQLDGDLADRQVCLGELRLIRKSDRSNRKDRSRIVGNAFKRPACAGLGEELRIDSRCIWLSYQFSTAFLFSNQAKMTFLPLEVLAVSMPRQPGVSRSAFGRSGNPSGGPPCCLGPPQPDAIKTIPEHVAASIPRVPI